MILVWMMVTAVLWSSAPGPGQEAAGRAEIGLPDGARISAEVADSPARRERGLMFRQRLSPNEGMIFVFDAPGEHAFWMKNTLIPLDMLWLDGEFRILHIALSVPPCRADPCPTYAPPPGTQASYVLELGSGVAGAHALRVGDALRVAGLGRRD